MKKSHRRPIAVILAAAVSLSAFGGFFTSSAADTEDKKEIKLVYEIDEDAVPAKTTDLSLFEPSTTDVARTNVPVGLFSKKGYIFSGWTYDGVVGYTSGQFVDLPDDADEVVFHMCWTNSSDPKYKVTYVLERDGMTFENPEWLEEEIHAPNEVFAPNDTTVFVEKETENGTLKYVSKWLTDGERVYSYGTKLVMPDHDLVLYPILYKKIQLTYFAGDVDRLNGNSEFTYEKLESTSDELAAKDRFSRKGFTLVGWTSSADGNTYKPTETVVMPSEDVVFTAVWQPIEYKVAFNPGNGGTVIKVPTLTDETLICPDPNMTVEGKHFAGWKASDGTIYQVGDEYKVLGALPGMGISFKGVWEDGDAPATTTAPASTTSTATTTATTSATATVTTTASTTEPVATGTYIDDAQVEGTWSLTKIRDKDGNDVDMSDFTQDTYVFDTDGKYTGSNSLTHKGEKYNYTLKWSINGNIVNVTAEEDIIGMPNLSKYKFFYVGDGIMEMTSDNGNVFTYRKVKFGDANGDNLVTVADSVAILQSVANQDKYGLSLYGKAAGDVDGEAGVTANDALTIQKYDANVYRKLPIA